MQKTWWIPNQFRLLFDPCFALPRRLESCDVERLIRIFLSYLIKHKFNHSSAVQLIFRVRVDCIVADLTLELTVDRR